MCEAKLHRPLDLVKYWCRVDTPAMNFGRMWTPGTEHDWYWIWYQSLIALRLCMPEYKYNLKWRGDHVELMMGSFERSSCMYLQPHWPMARRSHKLRAWWLNIKRSMRFEMISYAIWCYAEKQGTGSYPSIDMIGIQVRTLRVLLLN